MNITIALLLKLIKTKQPDALVHIDLCENLIRIDPPGKQGKWLTIQEAVEIFKEK